VVLLGTTVWGTYGNIFSAPVSETVVVDKRIPVWEWVFDFFVIPICSEYLGKKTE
jgi:hypothetical protein